ncbi:hypothetical protein UlMin_003965 [Ulmus minor]
MAIFAGSIGFKTQFQLQCRVFFIPWIKKKSAITCLKSRDYSSSEPVRYIPNKISKINKLESSQPMKGIKKEDSFRFSGASELRNGVNVDDGHVAEKSFDFDKKPRYQSRMFVGKLLLNGAEQDDVMEEPKEVAEELRIHQEKKRGEMDALQSRSSRTKYDAEKLAVKLLASRAFTAVELRKKLCGKNFSPDTVEALINDFQSRGLINDSLYAEAFCQSRWSSLSWGPRRIKQALFQKGVSKVDADKAINLVFKEEESDEYQESNHSLSKSSMDQLFVQASKQWLRGHDVPKETRKSRIIRWLQYRGFNWDVISIIVKKLESNHPP